MHLCLDYLLGMCFQLGKLCILEVPLEKVQRSDNSLLHKHMIQMLDPRHWCLMDNLKDNKLSNYHFSRILMSESITKV